MLRAFGLARAVGRSALVGPAAADRGRHPSRRGAGGGRLPVMPIGPMRRVEPASGLDVDLTAMGVGALLVLAVLSAFTVVVAWREAPQRVRAHRRALPVRRRSWPPPPPPA